jgi:hypothetical protein
MINIIPKGHFKRLPKIDFKANDYTNAMYVMEEGQLYLVLYKYKKIKGKRPKMLLEHGEPIMSKEVGRNMLLQNTNFNV